MPCTAWWSGVVVANVGSRSSRVVRHGTSGVARSTGRVSRRPSIREDGVVVVQARIGKRPVQVIRRGEIRWGPRAVGSGCPAPA